MAKKISIYSVDVYAGILTGIDNNLLAEQILKNHKPGNLSLIPAEDDRANGEEDSSLPETEEAAKLLNLILERVVEIIDEHYPQKKYNINFAPEMFGKKMVWSHVIYPNESTGYHSHHAPEDYNFLNLSCVYYVKTPPNCGRIKFVPKTHNNKTWSIDPEEGLLIIFPSWIPHYTLRNLSNDMRISISANFNIDQSN